jgi:hypothetical protein
VLGLYLASNARLAAKEDGLFTDLGLDGRTVLAKLFARYRTNLLHCNVDLIAGEFAPSCR